VRVEKYSDDDFMTKMKHEL